MRLKDKVAVVTGGGGGLGEGIALCLAKEGADVLVSDIKMDIAEAVAEKVRSLGRKSQAIQTDVRKTSECRTLIDTALAEMQRLDILVCSAGVMGYENRGNSTEPLTVENIEEKDWDHTIDVNLKGVFLCNQAVIPHFKEQKQGKIVNISSVAGRYGGGAFLAPYSASKAGVISWSQSMAIYLAPYGVNVNTVCPGIIWTPMWAEGVRVLQSSNPDYKDLDPKAIFDNIVDRSIPLKRVQSPEDIGNAVVFLVSEEAREITGQALNVCGGMRLN